MEQQRRETWHSLGPGTAEDLCEDRPQKSESSRFPCILPTSCTENEGERQVRPQTATKPKWTGSTRKNPRGHVIIFHLSFRHLDAQQQAFHARQELLTAQPGDDEFNDDAKVSTTQRRQPVPSFKIEPRCSDQLKENL